MSENEKLLRAKGFTHPCKETCSGWRQGYDDGHEAGRREAESEMKLKETVAYKCGYDSGKSEAIAEVVPTHAEINQEAREQFLGYEGAIFTSVNLVEAFRVGAKWVLAKLSAEG